MSQNNFNMVIVSHHTQMHLSRHVNFFTHPNFKIKIQGIKSSFHTFEY